MSTVAKLFLKLTKSNGVEIFGDAQTEYFARQIEIDDWNWSVGRAKMDANTSTINASGSSLGKGFKVEPSVFSFSKLMDRSSPALLAAMNSKESMTAEITLQEMSRGAFELKTTLTDVRVIEYKLDAKNEKAGASVDENWTFNYKSVKFDYKPAASSSGRGSGGTMTVEVTRPPDASTEKPASKFEQGVALIKEASPLNQSDKDIMTKLGT
ncbi:type VI secretion system tube protein Hcp [Roseateles sp. GG27B]